MVFYVRTAQDGTITSFGSGDVVPVGSIAVSSSQYDTLIASQPLNCRFVGGVISAIPLPVQAPVDLVSVKAQAILAVDQAAEKARLNFLTTGCGQVLEYTATQADAQRAIATGGLPIAADYPWLAAEQQALAAVGQQVTIMQVALAVVSTMSGWATAGVEIKRLRRTAKLKIDAASSVSEVVAASNVIWPTPT